MMNSTPSNRPKRIRKRKGRAKHWSHRKIKLPSRAKKIRDIYTVSGFRLEGPEMKQYYNAHCVQAKLPKKTPAKDISATCIQLYWNEIFNDIRDDVNKKQTRQLRKKEKDYYLERVASMKNYMKLKAARIPLEVGTDTDCMRYDIKRYNYRLYTDKRDPFGEFYKEDDVADTDPSTAESDLTLSDEEMNDENQRFEKEEEEEGQDASDFSEQDVDEMADSPPHYGNHDIEIEEYQRVDPEEGVDIGMAPEEGEAQTNIPLEGEHHKMNLEAEEGQKTIQEEEQVQVDLPGEDEEKRLDKAAGQYWADEKTMKDFEGTEDPEFVKLLKMRVKYEEEDEEFEDFDSQCSSQSGSSPETGLSRKSSPEPEVDEMA